MKTRRIRREDRGTHLSKSRPYHRRLRLEPLESRRLLAAVSWVADADGYWDEESNWSGGSAPGPDDDVTIDRAAGDFTITHRSSSTTVKSLSCTEKIALSGGSLTVTNAASVTDTLTLQGGTLLNTTLTVTGGSRLVATPSGGTLDGVTLNSDLDVSGDYAYVTVTDGLTLNGTATLAGAFSRIDVEGTQTFAGSGTIVFEPSQGNTVRLTQAGTTLTLGPQFTVRGGSPHGYSARLGYSDWFLGPTDVSVINQGTIAADVAGTSIVAFGQSFTNQGTLEATGGGHLYLGSQTVRQQGTTDVNAGTLSLLNDWNNTGIITSDNGTVNLGGSFTLADLGTFHRTGGTVNLTGTLDNSTTELVLDAVAGSWHLAGGTIQGGTVTVSDASQLVATTSGGTLDGVTLNSDLDVSGDYAYVTVTDGLTLNGTATLAGAFSRIDVEGTQTFAGSGTIVFEPSQGNTVRLTQAGTTLTLGPQFTVRGGSPHGYSARLGYSDWFLGPTDVSVINQGTIAADVAGTSIVAFGQSFTNQGTLEATGGGHLYLGSQTVRQLGTTDVNAGTLSLLNDWNNTGIITSDNGTVNLGGSFTLADLGTFHRTGGTVNLTGTLDNSTTELVLDAVAGSWHLAGGTIQGGTVTVSDASQLVATTSGGTLDGVTLNSDLDVSGDYAYVTVTDGLTLNGTATLAGAFSRIDVEGTQTFAGSGTIVFEPSQGNTVRLTQAGTTLTLGPQFTVRGGSPHGYSARLGYSDWFLGPTDVSVINQGTIAADVAGTSIVIMGQQSTNEGTLRADNGGALYAYLPLAINGSGILAGNGFGSGIIAISGNLTGDTQNADLYNPLNTVRLEGAGTPAAPQLLEVMGRDVGSAAHGFEDNFVYGELTLANNTYVQLVDLADNTPGTTAEAIYVHSLVVPSSTTLDLNGLQLYTRAAQINGTVAGGSITQIPDSGPMLFDTPLPGSIAVAGELDEWHFYGRAAQPVTISVNPGSGSSPAPLPPQLEFAEVILRDESDNVIATGSSSAAGEVVFLGDVVLPEDGNYRLQIKAPAAQPASTGNYLVTLWNTTVDIRPLHLSQQVTGLIESPYSVDRWEFSAVAGQQVQFDLVNASTAGIGFTLTGPSAFVGFTDITEDSGLINLTESGNYTLTVRGLAGQTGAYAFRLLETVQVDLDLGVPYSGTFAGSGQAQLFRLDVPANMPLRVTLDDTASENRNELYAKLAVPATRGDFDYRASNIASSDQQLLVPMAAAPTWYILVYADYVPTASDFTLLAEAAPVLLTGVTPDHHGNAADAILTVTGGGFDPTTNVELVATDTTTYSADRVELDSFEQITATFTAGAVPAGVYSVRVARLDGQSAELPDAFEVIDAGEAVLETQLIIPDTLGYHQLATIYIEYANTGDLAMPAPLLSLTAEQIGREAALLTLDHSILSQGFWTSAIPEGFSNSVQFLASGQTPGVLQPDETGRVPVYWAGWQQPWDFSYTPIQFRLRTTTAEDPTPIDWDAVKDLMRPDRMDASAWETVWANFTEAVGPTWGDYAAMLAENAAYLGRLGQTVHDVSDLIRLAYRQADGLGPAGSLSGSVDTLASAAGIPLGFGRSFANSIHQRYQLGPLGYGWAHSWQIKLEEDPDGTVRVVGMTDSVRTFQPDVRGGYLAAPGDHGTLTKLPGGAFLLTETNGRESVFYADGKFDELRDTNGNRITANYTGDRLTGLSHSTGLSLQIDYNGAGRIERVTDPYGRETQFSYDVTQEHLLSVEAPDGTITSYSYDLTSGASTEHALTQTSYPDGSHDYFLYDSQGRLSVFERDAHDEQLGFAYGPVGRATVSDAVGGSTEFFFDHRDRIAKLQNAVGNTVEFGFDVLGRLDAIVDPLGWRTTLQYDPHGNLLQLGDSSGYATTFSYGNLDRLTSVTDPNGHTTTYQYDARGNRTALVYADGMQRNVVVDVEGKITEWTNARGDTIEYEYDTQGRLTRKEYPDASEVVYVYDAHGNLTSAMGPDHAVQFTYNGLDRLERVDYPESRFLVFTYDPAGRRTSMTDHSGYSVYYAYDAVGRLERLSDGDPDPIVEYAYDAAGRLQREDLRNGVYTVYAYDPAGHLASVTNRAPDHSLLSTYEYTYDAAGRRVGLSTTDGSWHYEYDGNGQLTGAVFDAAAGGVPDRSWAYDYDPAGNRTSVTDQGQVLVCVSNARNQYTSYGAANLTYDADGNLTAKADGNDASTYVYDEENRLIAVTTPAGSWQYEYDPLGNRVATVHDGERIDYLIDPFGWGNVVGEYLAGGGLLARYTHALGLTARADATGDWFYYTFDGLGSTSELTDNTGAIAAEYAYGPFGTVLDHDGLVPNPFQFVGRLGVTHEGNGLSFMRARYYEPELGRFVSEDPLGLAGLDPNLYRYVGNSPLGWVDPTGQKQSSSSGSWAGDVAAALAQAEAEIARNNAEAAAAQATAEAEAAVAGAEADAADAAAAAAVADAAAAVASAAAAAAVAEADANAAAAAAVADAIASGIGAGPSGPMPSTMPSNSPQSGGDEAGTKSLPPGGTPTPSGPGQNGQSDAAAPRDPNQKLGPTGYGESGFVVADRLLAYRVDFENDPDATAPAQFVTITDQLDASLDWSSLELTEVGFGDTLIAIPRASHYFQTIVPMAYLGREFNVHVELGVDLATGLITAHFMSIDPSTSLPPDVLTGFLPPEDGTGRGMGYFSYVIDPKPGLPTGTEIRNIAIIQFDFGEIIATNQVDPHDPSQGIDPAKEALVTIDAGLPESSVLPLPAETTTSTFLVEWSGQDDVGGSGIGGYDVYVSTDGGPFAIWLDDITDTSAAFSGENGHSYAFYSIAIDNVGNEERPPAAADTQTTVVGSTLPADFDTDGDVDGDDFLVWQSGFGAGTIHSEGDADDDGDVDGDDFLIWQSGFGSSDGSAAGIAAHFSSDRDAPSAPVGRRTEISTKSPLWAVDKVLTQFRKPMTPVQRQTDYSKLRDDRLAFTSVSRKLERDLESRQRRVVDDVWSIAIGNLVDKLVRQAF